MRLFYFTVFVSYFFSFYLVAFAKALADQIMQADETLRLGMDRGDGPYPLGSSQASKNLRPPRPVHAASRPLSGRRGPA